MTMRSVLEQKKQSPAQQPLQDDYEGLRQMLEDFLLIGEHLLPLCDDQDHVLEVVRNALAENSQLKFLANVLKKAAKK